jgi:uncharacterized protein (DUF169 family)
MTDWAELSGEMERLLRLRTYPVAYKKLDKAEELENIPRVRRFDRSFASRGQFCQIPTIVRRGGLTIGVLKGDIGERCARIHGLAPTTEEALEQNAQSFSCSWFATVEEARKQMAVYPVIPPGEALVLAPLASGKFDPDVILIYGNPAQLMLLMSALQFKDYERYQFFYISEGSCVDGLGQCYNSGKPALAIPCFGERRYGGVEEDELVLALPPGMMHKAVEGLRALSARGLRYPIPSPVQPAITPRGRGENSPQ